MSDDRKKDGHLQDLMQVLAATNALGLEHSGKDFLGWLKSHISVPQVLHDEAESKVSIKHSLLPVQVEDALTEEDFARAVRRRVAERYGESAEVEQPAQVELPLSSHPRSPDYVRLAMEKAAEDWGDSGRSGRFVASAFGRRLQELAGLSLPAVLDGKLVKAILSGRLDVAEEGGGYYRILVPKSKRA